MKELKILKLPKTRKTGVYLLNVSLLMKRTCVAPNPGYQTIYWSPSDLRNYTNRS
jgi:hypothetical protein